MNSRRAILKLIGAAPVAASSAASQLVPLLSSPTVIAAAALAGNTSTPLPQSVGYGALGPIIRKQMQLLVRQTEDEIYLKRAMRVQGLDGDLGAMRSVSRGWKERQQIERDTADNGLLRHAQSVMLGS